MSEIKVPIHKMGAGVSGVVNTDRIGPKQWERVIMAGLETIINSGTDSIVPLSSLTELPATQAQYIAECAKKIADDNIRLLYSTD